MGQLFMGEVIVGKVIVGEGPKGYGGDLVFWGKFCKEILTRHCFLPHFPIPYPNKKTHTENGSSTPSSSKSQRAYPTPSSSKSQRACPTPSSSRAQKGVMSSGGDSPHTVTWGWKGKSPRRRGGLMFFHFLPHSSTGGATRSPTADWDISPQVVLINGLE